MSQRGLRACAAVAGGSALLVALSYPAFAIPAAPVPRAARSTRITWHLTVKHSAVLFRHAHPPPPPTRPETSPVVTTTTTTEPAPQQASQPAAPTQAPPPPVVEAPGTLLSQQPAWLQSVFACIRYHESHTTPTVWNYTGSGASGLYQFMQGTWLSHGGAQFASYAAAASVAAQNDVAVWTYEATGFSPWQGDPCLG